jgi:hypothetical protein
LQETDAVVDAIWTALLEESGHAGSHSAPSPPQPSNRKRRMRPSP